MKHSWIGNVVYVCLFFIPFVAVVCFDFPKLKETEVYPKIGIEIE